MPDIYSLIQGSGPGQVNDVLADIRALVDNDQKVTTAARPELVKYNKEQFTSTQVSGKTVLVTPFNELSDGIFYDAISGTKFDFDHVSGKASNAQPHDLGAEPAAQASTLSELARVLGTYLEQHYPSHAALSITPLDDTLKICIVGNKYNTANFWTGRWRGTYTYSATNKTLNGQVVVDVHYYEDGNVRLLTSKDLDLSTAVVDGTPESVGKSIEVAERRYQEELNRAFGVLGEGSFKDLRRALPVTRSKINWNSVAAMRIGQEVQGGREKK